MFCCLLSIVPSDIFDTFSVLSEMVTESDAEGGALSLYLYRTLPIKVLSSSARVKSFFDNLFCLISLRNVVV